MEKGDAISSSHLRSKKNTGLDVGDVVEMRFRIDDQDHVDVPRALEIAIQSNDEANRQWNKLTAGKKRMFTFHVASSKTATIGAERVAEAIDAIGKGCGLRDLKR